MFNVTVYETAEEIIEAFRDDIIPSTVHIVIDSESAVYFSGEGSQRFDVSAAVTADRYIQALAKAAGTRLYLM